jgi:predicted amidohydrolase YtcJ
MKGIHAAVTCRRADGSPGLEGWYPPQRISVDEAVRAYTAGAAYASGEEVIKGTLSPGKLADLDVLSQSIPWTFWEHRLSPPCSTESLYTLKRVPGRNRIV